jgi:hypothetical protein
MSGGTSSTAPARGRWLRFSLRSLIVAVAITGVVLGIIVHTARRQRLAVETIQSAGGTVFYAYQQTSPRSWSTGGTPSGPAWLRQAIGGEFFDRPIYVGLFGSPQDEDWIDAFNRIPTTETLLLSGDNVADDTLRQLAASTSLIELHLSGSRISDDALRQLAKFPRLRWLVINHTSVTATGVAHLTALSDLEELNLRSTALSDAAVTDLSTLTGLQKLDVRDTAISDGGAEELQRQLPNCQILH